MADVMTKVNDGVVRITQTVTRDTPIVFLVQTKKTLESQIVRLQENLAKVTAQIRQAKDLGVAQAVIAIDGKPLEEIKG